MKLTSMKNTKQKYGWISILFHWLSLLIVLAMIALGVWMVDLDYYDSWYKAGPALHKSIGLSFFLLMLARVIWRTIQTQPESLPTHTKTEKKWGQIMHLALYGSIFLIMMSGYLISTADGRGILVFELFSIPGFDPFIENQEDIAGVIHEYAAYTLILMVIFHAGAALKHHIIDKDNTLKRILGLP